MTFFRYMIIEFDNLAKWLNLRKDTLKRTLERTYTKNIDYKITIIKSLGKGRPTEEIIITPDCMKRICMLSASAKSEEVRSYFIKIEKLLDKYKQFIIDELNKKVGILEQNQKPKINPKRGVIYVIRSSKTTEDIFKLGRSKRFLARLMAHNSIEADDIEIMLLYETNNIVQVENCVKNALRTKQYRKRKEIYEVDMDTIKQVISGCDNIISKVKNTKKTKTKLNIVNDNNKKNLFMFFLEKTETNKIELSKENKKIKINRSTVKKSSKKLPKK